MQLWLRLERTRRLLGGQCKRFCIRNVLKSWFYASDDLPLTSHLTLGHLQTSLHGPRSLDDFIWEVCRRVDIDGETVCGWDELQPPSLYPRKHRELLKAIVEVRLNLTPHKVNLKALDAAYSIAFPKSTPLNVHKKKR